MNKYYGLLEIDALGLPAIKWMDYQEGMKLNENCLWTIRTANNGNRDMYLPHKIGISADEAYVFAKKCKKYYDHVFASEFFYAKISGSLMIDLSGAVIEWVEGNSTELTRHGKVNETIRIFFDSNNDSVKTILSNSVFEKLKEYARVVAYKEKEYLFDNKLIIMEWSIIDSNKTHSYYSYKEGELIFYDMRII